MRARKTITVDYKKGKKMKNDGIRESAFVPNHHGGIVTPEIARAAHMMASSRRVDGVPDIRDQHGKIKGIR